MLQNLTQVADYKGVRFVCDEKLSGKKYAERYKGRDEIHVSPAVFALLPTDLDLIAKSLKVRILPARRSRRRRG